MKVIFGTFADNKYMKSLSRIEDEARRFSCFHEICIFHEEDIDTEYMKIIKPWLYRRGFGYWRWKSYFAKRLFDRLNKGDVLVWADAGCVLNYKAESVLIDYIIKAQNTNSGLLVFEQNKLEKNWTKGDLFEYLQADEETKNSPQLLGGVWVAVKTPISISLINKWYDICRNHGDLVTDKRSIIPNAPDFKEHRHDQSVFSLLVKQTDAVRVPFSKDGNRPILTKRKKEKRFLDMIKSRILIPWRYLIGCYLKYREDFFFNSRLVW